MSLARDRLMALVFKAASRGAYEGLADETRTAMDNYAHELAEKQRDQADLIDPEIKET